MQNDKLKIDFTNLYQRAKKLTRKVNFKGATINLPFISIELSKNENEKKIAKEIIIRLRQKRVLNSKECCNNCITNSLDSLIDIRKILVDKQVEIEDVNSPLFFLTDFALHGIKQFLSYTEYYDPKRYREIYFEALEIIRGHLLRIIDGIKQISELPEDFGYSPSLNNKWDEQLYFIDKNLIE